MTFRAPAARLRRWWPHSLTGQILFVLALALLLAQGINTALLYRIGTERRREVVIHNTAFRLLAAMPPAGDASPSPSDLSLPPGYGEPPRPAHTQVMPDFTAMPGDRRWPDAENQVRRILTDQGFPTTAVLCVERFAASDPPAKARIARQTAIFASTHRSNLFPLDSPAPPARVLLVAVRRQAQGPWLVVRELLPTREAGWHMLASLLAQTVLIYLVLVGAMALILRHITRPLAALTGRLEQFTETRATDGQLTPDGPDDIRRLIEAHNAMEGRILALLDEKDVMLGAIGHDLKTPLTALRVRIENVEDADERARMAATIEDIVISLDDILSLARVGRPSDPMEVTELSALIAFVVEDYEDMGEAVTLERTCRIVLPLRATWLRRALRNLIGNALRYGGAARVSLMREEGKAGRPGFAVIQIEDDGPGIPEHQIARMMEPFTRGEPSRNSETGGAGLGLTLARAIAEQHGGTLTLINRPAGGLTATLRLPLD